MGELKNNDSIEFEDKKIRTAWDEEQEEWYFSIVDVISVLTGTENPRRYWSDLKRKPNRSRHGWQEWAGNGLRKSLTRNRPLTGRWKPT